jgi:hypothetical protein
MRRYTSFQRAIPLVVTLTLISFSAAPAPSQTATLTDPFAYCKAVGTIDAPDARFVGPKMPEAVAKGLMQAVQAPPDAPLDVFVNNSFWRCMNGKVYACTVGANLPCQAKANTNKTPTQAEKDFCKQRPNAEIIPAAVTGRETIYEWNCINGTPNIVKQQFRQDAGGFLANFWHEISP